MNKTARTRLVPYLVEMQRTQFSWGKHDCCLFASNWIELATGFNPMANYIGSYSTEVDAKRMLIKHGGGSVKAAFTAVFGELKPRLNAVCGDLILIDTNHGDAVGVLHACQIWAMSPTGLITLPLSHAIGCWPLVNLKEGGE